MTTTEPTTSIRTEEKQGFLARMVASPVVRLIASRVGIAIPTLLAVSFLTFLMLEAIPGDPARNIAGMDAPEETVAALREKMGLNRPAYERYLSWLGGFVTGNLGISVVSGQPVGTTVLEKAPVTLELVLLAFVVALLIAIPLALLAALRPGGIFDRIAMVVSMTLLAVPNYVMALLLVLVFSSMLHVLPSLGYQPLSKGLGDNLRFFILPTLALAIPLATFYTRFLRGDLVEQLNSADYVETARAKGVGPWRVLTRHAFRNSSFGLLTLVGLNVGGLVGGTVIVENIFSLPGLGVWMLSSVGSKDIAPVQTCVFIFAAVAVIANLVVDIMYAVLDPRIRYGSR